ncbi:MAG: MerR family transcriptional regulator [Bacteroidetes bacterium QH_10_64_37]|jgi:DNA-binding transcriptional MerR regulator|nr:MAG: MerR family transcriptional regulator [Bacteroidetes bacterium QH_10_64_37]
MPEDEIEKLYYSIGEVSERVGQEAHVLRYWEQEFDVLNPRKNRAGRRVYTSDDIETVERIRHLLKDEKYTIEGARQAIERDERKAEVQEETEDDLKTLRSFLVELREQLEFREE